jgi:hypothetical protein
MAAVYLKLRQSVLPAKNLTEVALLHNSPLTHKQKLFSIFIVEKQENDCHEDLGKQMCDRQFYAIQYAVAAGPTPALQHAKCTFP